MCFTMCYSAIEVLASTPVVIAGILDGIATRFNATTLTYEFHRSIQHKHNAARIAVCDIVEYRTELADEAGVCGNLIGQRAEPAAIGDDNAAEVRVEFFLSQVTARCHHHQQLGPTRQIILTGLHHGPQFFTGLRRTGLVDSPHIRAVVPFDAVLKVLNESGLADAVQALYGDIKIHAGSPISCVDNLSAPFGQIAV